MTVGSLFSGIGGFDKGFHDAAFDVRWQVEIEQDCVNVLTKHWPTVRKYRDVNAVVYGQARNRRKHGLLLEHVDVIVGGFPCQDLSVAGKRAGLEGSRSGLFFAFMRCLRIVKPTWAVIENVPGLFTSNRGRDFHTVLRTLADSGFRRAYRVLDSQYFGVPQRRRRVFLVGCLRGSRHDPAEVLFESAGRDGNSATSQQARPRVAATLRGRAHGARSNEPGRGGEDDSNLVMAFDNRQAAAAAAVPATLRADSHGANPMVAVGVHANQRGELRTSDLAGSLNGSRSAKQFEGVAYEEVAHALTSSRSGMRFDPNGEDYVLASPVTASAGHHGHSSPRGDGHDNLIAATLNSGGNSGGFRTEPGEHLIASTMQANSGRNHIEQHYEPVAFDNGQGDPNASTDGTAFSLNTQSHGGVCERMGVRRLTPLECERLQGFPDGWTCLCGNGHKGSSYCTCPDTPRYRGLGNAVTVPVARWIAERIHDVQGLN